MIGPILKHPKPQPYEQPLVVVISLAASATVVPIWASYWALRYGFATAAFFPSITLVGIAFAILNVPAVALVRLDRSSASATGNPRIWTPPLVCVAVLATVYLAGLLPEGVASVVGIAIALLGVAALVLNVADAARRKLRFSAGALLGLLLLAGGLAGASWESTYSSPVFLERMLFRETPVDPWFHSAITSMIQTFGHASIGLDGAPLLRYHTGSHHLFASLSTLSRLEAIEFYQVGYPLFVLPLLVFTIVLLGARLCVAVNARQPRVDTLSRHPWIWLGLLLLLVGVSSVRLGGVPLLQPLGQGHWITSESYGVAIALAALLGSLLADAPAVLEGRGLGSWLFACVALPMTLAVAGFAKVSVLVVVLPTALFVSWRAGYLRDRRVIVGLVTATILSVGVLLSASAVSGGTRPLVLGFYRMWLVGSNPLPPILAAIAFLAGHYLLTLTYLALPHRYVAMGRREHGNAKSDAVSPGRIATEALVMVALLGAAPGLLLDIDGGSALYFSDVQRYLAGALILSEVLAADLFGERVPRRPADAVTVGKAAIGVAAVLLVASVGWRALGGVLDVRASLRGTPLDADLTMSAARMLLQDQAEDGRRLESAPAWQNIRRVRALRASARRVRESNAIYVPRTDAYWSVNGPVQSALAVPALSGGAMVYGAPSRAGAETRFEGIGWIEKFQSEEQTPPAGVTIEEVSARARAKGFDGLLVFGPDAVERVELSDR